MGFFFFQYGIEKRVDDDDEDDDDDDEDGFGGGSKQAAASDDPVERESTQLRWHARRFVSFPDALTIL